MLYLQHSTDFKESHEPQPLLRLVMCQEKLNRRDGRKYNNL